MRQIKFRAWDGEQMHVHNDGEQFEGMVYNTARYAIIHRMEIQWMQFTGLLDKNGKEIYEGDVVKFHDHPTGNEDGIGKVYWKDGKWMLTWTMVPLGDYGTAWTEVIGNIHEHPHLLSNQAKG